MRTKMLSLWKNKLNSLQNEYDLLVIAIKDNYPDYYKLKYDNQVADLASIQKGLLDENTALLSYFTGTKNTYVFYVGSNEISIRKIEDTSALFDQTVDLFTIISSLSHLRNAPQLAYDEFYTKWVSIIRKTPKARNRKP